MNDSSDSLVNGRKRRLASNGVNNAVAAVLSKFARKSLSAVDGLKPTQSNGSAPTTPSSSSKASALASSTPTTTMSTRNKPTSSVLSKSKKGALSKSSTPAKSKQTTSSTKTTPTVKASTTKTPSAKTTPTIKKSPATTPTVAPAAAVSTPSLLELNSPATPSASTSATPFEEALAAQQREYAVVDATNSFRTPSTSADTATPTTASGRPSRNKSRPLAEFAPELFRARRPQQEERPRQPREQRRHLQSTSLSSDDAARRQREAELQQQQLLNVQIAYEAALKQQKQHVDMKPPPLPQLSVTIKEELTPVLPPLSTISTPHLATPSGGPSAPPPTPNTANSYTFDGTSTPAAAVARRASRSISSPAIASKRYAAYGTQRAINPNAPPSVVPTANLSHQFYERMRHRARHNPLACGLVSSATNTPLPLKDDYFYREVLVRATTKQPKSMPFSLATDETIDVVNGDTGSSPPHGANIADMVKPDKYDDDEDEILVKIVAEDCAADIRNVLPLENLENDMVLRAKTSGSDAEEDAEPLIERLKTRVAMMQADDNLQAQHLKTLLPAIINQRYTDLQTLHVVGGCSLLYARSLKNAATLRQHLVLYNNARRKAMVDAHIWLICKLPNEFLASYLNLLRYLKISNSTLPQLLIESGIDTQVCRANEIINDYVSERVVDPNLRFGKAYQDIQRLPNVSLVLVYPQVTMPGQVVTKHAHENMFRNLLSAAVRCVEKVELQFDQLVDTQSLVHMCLGRIRSRVQEIVKRRPDDHVFLAGWGVSSLLCMLALQKVNGVSGVLNFAFPLRSKLNFRGSVDDSICITYCPALFIVGNAAINVNLRDLEAMRANMISDTGLVVVGGADDNLYVTPSYLSVERVSQHCVDRILLDHVVDFMRQVIDECGMSARERRDFLVPVKTPNPFDVDLSTLKGRSSSSYAPGKQRAQQQKDAQAGDNRKAKISKEIIADEQRKAKVQKAIATVEPFKPPTPAPKPEPTNATDEAQLAVASLGHCLEEMESHL